MQNTREVKLEEVTAYQIIVPALDMHSKPTHMGYWYDKDIAEVRAKGIGGYGEDGNVSPIKIYTSVSNDTLSYYKLEKMDFPGFQDNDIDARKMAISEVVAKLTDAELRLLGVNVALYGPDSTTKPI